MGAAQSAMIPGLGIMRYHYDRRRALLAVGTDSSSDSLHAYQVCTIVII